MCANIRATSQSLVQSLASFTICALTVLSYIGSFAESDKESIKEENKALQRLTAGQYNNVPLELFCSSASRLGSFWMLTELPSRVSAPYRVTARSITLRPRLHRIEQAVNFN